MAEARSGHNKDEGLGKPSDDQLLKELQTPVMHAAECQDSQCDVTDCKKIKRLFNHSSICEVRGVGGCNICQGLWVLISFHANSCSTSNCPVPTCKEWRENFKKNSNESESGNSEDVGKHLLKLTIDPKAEPSAGKQQAVRLVEPKPSKGKGALATGSASGPGSGSGSVTSSTASHQKTKQQVDSVSTKSMLTAKLLQELVMGSVSCSCSDQGLGSSRSARQRRMKRRVAEGSRKNKSQVQPNRRWDEYTDQDKRIILGATYLIFFALLLKNQICHI